MNTPDKVFVALSDGSVLEDYVGPAWRKDDGSCQHFEYIRKDALVNFLENTKTRKEKTPTYPYNNEDYQAGFIDGYDRLRENIINEFDL